MHGFTTDRFKAGAGVALIHALIAYAFLVGLVNRQALRPEAVMTLIDVQPPAPPPPPEPVHHARHVAPKKASGAAAPPNLKAKPTEIVAPPPPIPLIVPPPVQAAPRADQGVAARSGAAQRLGPGTGAGGVGNGSGSGRYGNGEGGGGDGVAPRQIGGRLKYSDYPHDIPRSAQENTVSVQYRVGIDGRVSNCVVTRSSGIPELDATTCRLIEQRFRYRPARDEQGNKVSSTIVENQTWVNRPIEEEAAQRQGNH